MRLLSMYHKKSVNTVQSYQFYLFSEVHSSSKLIIFCKVTNRPTTVSQSDICPNCLLLKASAVHTLLNIVTLPLPPCKKSNFRI